MLLIKGLLLVHLIVGQIEGVRKKLNPLMFVRRGDGYQDLWQENESSAEMIKSTLKNVLKQFRNSTENPCINFYKHSCGNYKKFSGHSATSSIYFKIRESLLKILEDYNPLRRFQFCFPGEQENFCLATEAEIKAVNFFKSCVNTELINERGRQSANDFIRTFNGWPFETDEDFMEEFEWLNATAQIRLLGKDVLISETVKSSVIYLEPDLAIPKRTFTIPSAGKKQQVPEYDRIQIRKLLEFYGVDSQRMENHIEDIVDFDSKLYSIYDASTKESRIFTVPELIERIPQINWQNYLNIVLGRKISRKTRVTVTRFEYFSELARLVNETSTLKLRKYLFFRLGSFLRSFAQNSSPMISRKISCTKETERLLEVPFNAIFVRTHYSQAIEDDVGEMFEDIRKEYLRFINDSDWIESSSKIVLSDKMMSVDIDLGTFKEADFIETLKTNFSSFEILEDQYFENMVQLLRYRNSEEQKRLGKTPIYPANVNAYYLPSKNLVKIPIGVLQPPYYKLNFPMWAKYAGIGFLIAHELGHVIDNNNFVYDKNYNRSEEITNRTVASYWNKTLCLDRQHNNFIAEDGGQQTAASSLPGTKILAEDIADTFGMRFTIAAYKQWICAKKERAVGEMIRDFELSPMQLFFLSYGQNRCLPKYNPEIDQHGSGEFRVVGILSNQMEFGVAYQCACGTRMNPEQKCNFM